MRESESAVRHALIDADGEFVDLNSKRISSKFDRQLSRAAIVQYLITNMGWVEFVRNARGMRLRCRPAIISDTTLATVLFEMADNPDCPIALSVLGSEWRHLIHAGHRDVVTLIEGMRIEHSGKQRLLRIRRQAAVSPHHRTSQILQDYCVSARTASEVVDFCNRLYLGGRWSLSHFNGDDPRLVMDYVSDGFTPFNSGWVSHYSSSSLDAYAGQDYARWVAKTRAHAIVTRETIYDDVDATIPFPGIGLSRLRYARATIPVRLACGSMHVVSCAVTDMSIRLKEAG